jgi:hypothetical protein
MNTTFRATGAAWRGLGRPASGLLWQNCRAPRF